MEKKMTPHVYPRQCAFKSIEDIKGKKVTIMGLGLNGGGEAAVRFFLKKGAYVTVTDMKTEEQLAATVEKLNSDKSLDHSRLTYRLGEHRIEDFESADCVIKNPGVKFEGNKYLAAARAIESDLSIFLRFTNCPIIAVTGSKGKSSTVSAIYYGLSQAGYTSFLGGNITVSPLTFFDEVSSDTPVVIEFSSWQLADLRGRGVLRPHISVITKIVPDHQNWYGDMESYVADKRLIYADQTKGDYSIFDSDDWGDRFAEESKATVLRYGAKAKWSLELGELLVPGPHMKINAQNAALVMHLMGVPDQRIKEILQKWPGIDHRLQYFHSWKNEAGTRIKFYNDSCATVPEAAAAASQAFGKPVILMTGGTEKGLELTPLIQTLTAPTADTIKVKDLYLLAGTATDKLVPELDKAGVKYHGPYDGLDALLNEAKTNLLKEKAGEEIFVFSPGATSFGMFQNEFDRGNKYMAAVKAIFK
jgi:UDP-N-acetylmuramoylalanine--D-glutamate ligase